MNEKLVLAIAIIGVLVSMLSVSSKAQIAQTTGIVYINADGSISPSTAAISTFDNETYTLTDNINGSIVVYKNSIVIDGNGYMLQGTAAYGSIGIDLSGRTNVTVKNTQIENFDNGVLLYSSSSNSVSGNNITANSWYGIQLDSSSNNSVSGNNITNNNNGIDLNYYSSSNDISGNNITASNYNGICLLSSSDNNISENNITASNYYGIELSFSSENNISGNSINSNAVNNYDCICLFSSSSNNISGNNVTANNGIELSYSSNNNSISGNNITNNYFGVLLDSSSSNSISGNTFTDDGLFVVNSYQNSVENDTVNGKPLVYLEGVADFRVGDAGQVVLVRCDRITVENLNLSRTSVGVQLCETNNSIISWNNIVDSYDGIYLESSSNYNSISGNNITNNGFGIWLDSSSDNNISGNNVTANYYVGIWLSWSSSNKIYHNNINNPYRQVWSFASINVWDNGYPSGGNYWSDYNGIDVYSGPYQNESGFDWIGDSPYVIGQNNTDRYPLMNPYSSATGETELAYRDLLMKSDQLQTSLNANINDLEGQVNILNSTANYLKIEVDNLTLTLNQTSSSFQGQIDSLGNTITGLQAQITSLNSTLQTSTSNTQKQYNSLNSQFDTISKIMYLLAAMTAALIVTAVYFVVRKPKQKRLQLP